MKHPNKLIYNPNSGKKWWTGNQPKVSLEEIRELLFRYQIPVDEFPTTSIHHAYELAKASVKEGYKMAIVAGGDGTVGQVANGLIYSPVALGILPLGSYMNVAKMLAIPRDLEMAVQLLKIGRTRKIDVGMVTMISGKKPAIPSYFLESIGMGLEAELHQHLLFFEKGEYNALFKVIMTFFNYYRFPIDLATDTEEIRTRATLVSIANGPYTGATLEIAPGAKLNDHRLTISLFSLTKFELFNYFYHLIPLKKAQKKKIKFLKTKKVTITTKNTRLIHADARVFGTTPFSCEIVPNALTVVTGFPTTEESALKKRTYLDP